MKIIEKTPDKILVNTDFFKSAIIENAKEKETVKEYENSKNVLLACIGGLTSCLLTLVPSWSTWNIFLRGIVLFFTVVFFISSLWFLSKCIQSRQKLKTLEKKDLETKVIDEAKGKIRYTALLIICYQKAKTGDVKFMTEKQGNFLIHCDMIPDKNANEQKENIINYLATSYSIQKNQIIDISPLSSEPFFSIKPIHGEATQNGFIFFQVKLKKRAKQDLVNHRDSSWKSIREMEEMPELMGRNQDIIMALNDNKTRITESFGDSYGPIHIIWNITNVCPYNCAFCATYDESRQELSTDDKLKVLNHIFSAQERISTLDFAGGDPMCQSGVCSVILQAINSLGEDHVSVTTTGKGIESMESIPDEDISKLLKRCEITIDASHENLAPVSSRPSIFSRKSPRYCDHNYEQIQNVSENLEYLIINIPILDDDLSDEEINVLISKLTNLKQDYSEIQQIEAQIIRLMPVGAFNNYYTDNNKYKKYDPIDIAKKIKVCVDNIGIDCRYHCSLRVLPRINEHESRCNMLDRKIGIDCSGNVFACTWGAYLHLQSGQGITENPFYLGNLVKSNLKDILSGQASKTTAYKRITRDIINQTDKPYCEAVSWFFKNNVLDENNDPLSK